MLAVSQVVLGQRLMAVSVASLVVLCCLVAHKVWCTVSCSSKCIHWMDIANLARKRSKVTLDFRLEILACVVLFDLCRGSYRLDWKLLRCLVGVHRLLSMGNCLAMDQPFHLSLIHI